MNIKQLRYVTAILSTGSFSSAAACEGVSVQAVSKAMSELEGEVGDALFIRTSSGVTPTPLGEAFGARADKVLTEFDALERFVHTRPRSAGATGRFVVGFCAPEFPGVQRFCALIKTVTARALGCETDVLLTDAKTCVDELRAGRFCALITLGPVKGEGVVCGRLGTMMPAVVMAAENPLAEKVELTLEDINTRPVLLYPGYEHFNDSVCRAYASRGMTSELVEITSPEGLAEFIHDRQGLSLAVGGEFLSAYDGCVLRPIAAKDRIPVPICLSSLSGAGVSYLELSRALAKMKILF